MTPGATGPETTLTELGSVRLRWAMLSSRHARTTLTGLVFMACAAVGLVGPVAAVFLLAWAADASGLARALDPPRPSVDDAHLVLSGVSYEDLRGTEGCLQSCRGHEAGFEWARRHRVSQALECGGRSRSFIEGCWAYGDEVARITR